MPDLINRSKFPALCRLVDAALDAWPEHREFLEKSLPADDADELHHAEGVAALIGRLLGPGPAAGPFLDYRWTCERLLEEELHFHRTGGYRLKTFVEAKHQVYDDPAFMGRYVNGLLLSHLFWSNHRRVLRTFAERFLAGNPSGFRHLEVGPGHGLYLYLAAGDAKCRAATGWDVSDTSVSETRTALAKLGAPGHARVERRDVLGDLSGLGPFDSVVVSEVLEHLEDPARALVNLGRVMAPGGRIFVNMPVNSPAPDHIYLLESPEQVSGLVTENGFRATETLYFPATGYTEARARKAKATLSCVVIAVHP